MFNIINNLNKFKIVVDKFHGVTTIGFATISSTVISGLFWFYIAGLLGTSNYGEVSYIIALSGSVLTFLLFGGGNTFLVFIPKGIKIQPPVYFISLTAISIVSIVIYFIFYDIGLCLLIIGNGVFGLVVSELLGLKLYKKYAVYFITQKFLMVILSISLYYVMGFDGIIVGIGLSYFPTFLQVYQVFKDRPKINFLIITSRLKFIFTSYLYDVTRTFATTLDKIIVASMLGFALLGNYQIGIQVLSVLMILPGVLYSYTLPHDASGNSNKKLKTIGVLFSIVLVIPAIILSPIVIPIVLPEFTESITVIQIISISLIPITISTLYISKFLGEERIRDVLIGSSIFILVNIIILLTIVQIYSVNGVAASYLIGASAEAIYLFIVNQWSSKKNSKLTENNSFQKVSLTNYLKKNKFHIPKGTILLLIIIGIIGLLLRLYNFPYDVPLVLDAFNSYFFYATDVSILSNLPNWSISNIGWPLSLSFFFSIFNSDNFLDYMNLQRIITISISILTIIPLYFLCRKFFNKFYAVLGVALFIFEPHMIQNSSLGLTEPLFIILVTISITLFLGSSTKSRYISFLIIGLASIVRIEGLFVFLAFSIAYFIQNRHENKIIIKYLFGLVIFVTTLLPFIFLQMKTYGENSISIRLISGVNNSIQETVQENSASLISGYLVTLENIVKLGGWTLVPYFVILIPIGIYLILRNRERNTDTILIILSIMFIPVIIAFSWTVRDTRLFYPLFPLLSIVSIFPIIKFIEKFNRKKILVILIIGIILLSSIFYLEIKKYDLNHEREAFMIAKNIVGIANGVNSYYPEDSYIGPSEISEKWPSLKNMTNFKTKIVSVEGFNSLENYIKESKKLGLTHLVIDDKKERNNILVNVFKNEEKYPYLIKQYDSIEYGYTYHVKIFKIDYKIFENAMLIKIE